MINVKPSWLSLNKTTSVVLTIFVLLLFSTFFIVQFWSTVQFQNKTTRALNAIDNAVCQNIGEQKTKQETISLIIKNAQESIFISALVGKIAAGIGISVALLGSILGVFNFVEIRRKEISQIAAATYIKHWENIASDNPKHQASAVTGLADYLDKSFREYHAGMMAALSLVGKIHALEHHIIAVKNDEKEGVPTCKSAMTIAEGAFKRVIELAAESTTEEFSAFSWHGIKCYRADFSRVKSKNFDGIDFRDADLVEANFTGFSLCYSKFNAAKLNGAKFTGAQMQHADLQHADLTAVDFEGANLCGANLRNCKILNTNFKDTNLCGAQLSLYSTDWRLSLNWRLSKLDDPVRKFLVQKYSPPAQGPRILLLLWEFPHVVSGGGWTAAFHYITEMRRRCAYIIILVPWPKEFISPYILGNEVEIYPVGNSIKEVNFSLASAYESTYHSQVIQPFVSQYSLYSDEESQYYAASKFELVNNFAHNALELLYEKKIEFDVIHADDWLTFPAARTISAWSKKPWIAHFHSTEHERKTRPVNAGVFRIEKTFPESASLIITPSRSTKSVLIDKYNYKATSIKVIANCLSRSETETEGFGCETVGDFHGQRVVFAGRLQWQKGFDIFIALASELSFIRPGTNFCVYGRGEKRYEQMARDTELCADYTIKWDEARKKYIIDSERLQRKLEIRRLVPISFDGEDDERKITVCRQITSMEEMNTEIEQLEKYGFFIEKINIDDEYLDLPGYRFLLTAKNEDGGFHKKYMAGITGSELSNFTNRSTKKIGYRGFKQWEKRQSVFENASVCVVPSRFEPFGLIILEAMANGVPVIYPEQSGVAEIINTGIKIDFKKKDEVLNAICNLLDDLNYWEKTVNEQLEEISAYYQRPYADELQKQINQVAEMRQVPTTSLPADSAG
ncbi:MAG: pentapeptide repeat-containing protein [Chitinivibrionales bacterium]|nr:pentapeptide repeat-containing protein [Chitinivibrionales bacterium]